MDKTHEQKSDSGEEERHICNITFNYTETQHKPNQKLQQALTDEEGMNIHV